VNYCFEYGIDYLGDALGGGLGGPYQIEDGPEACQEKCATISGCNFFTYVPVSNECHLKFGQGSITPADSLVSGPAFYMMS